MNADSGVSDERVSLPDGPGSIGGVGENAEVSPGMGAMRYQVAIDLPEGFRGMTPSLALAYSSTSGGGVVGIGWELAVPHIERMSLRGLPEYGVNDVFAADGSAELVYVGDDAGARVYRARFEGGFARYKWFEAGTGSGGYWTAELPDGTKSWFGADTSGTRVGSAVVEDAGGRVFRYQVVATTDPFGHVIRYGYDKPGDWPLLSSVGYVFDGSNPRFSATLAYEDRPDVISTCVPGFDLKLTKRLARISVLSRSQLMRSYELDYEEGTTSGGFSRLTHVAQFASDGTPSPIHFAFEYSRVLGDACSGPECQSPRMIDMGTLSGGVDLGTGRATLLDINGDALPDMLSVEPDGSHSFHIARIGADGNPYFEEPKSSAATEGGSSFVLGAPGVQVLDVNGDGFTDIVSSRVGEVLCNDGTGDWNGTSCLMNSTLPQLESDDEPGDQNPLYSRFFDYDSDKRIDMLQTLDGATLVYHNDGDEFVQQEVDEIGARFDIGDNTLQLADMNGDGLQDPVELPPGGKVRYRLNLGFGHWTEWVDVDLPGLDDAVRSLTSLEDLDGDGLADIVVVAGNEVRYARNHSDGGFEDFVTLTPDDVDGDLPERTSSTIVLFADMNGSGSDDVVWVTSDGHVSFLELFPVKPNLLSRIENGLGSVQRFHYGTSVQEQARDSEDAPWPHRVPYAMNVVLEADRWVTLTGGDDGEGLHELTKYRYHDGYYDGREKAFRGYGRVEQTDAADAGDDSQQPGAIVYRFDQGAEDVYRNGLLLSRAVLSGDVDDDPTPLVEERTEYDDCPVDGIPAASELRLPIRFVCPVRQLKVIQEGAPEDEWVTLQTDMRYDGYGHVSETDELGIADKDGDERFERTTYIEPGTDTGGLWILGMPSRSIQYGEEGGPQTETRNYYDGDAFEGLPLGTLTAGLPTRVEMRVSEGDGGFIQSRRVRFDDNGQPIELLDPLGDPDDASAHRRKYVYDALGLNVVRVEIATRNDQGEPRLLRREVAYEDLWNEPAEATGWIVVDGGKAQTARQSAYFRYDALGRVERIVRDGDSNEAPTERYSYDLGDPFSYITVHRRSQSGGDEDLTQLRCLDGLGREYQRRTLLSSGSYWVTGFLAFNARGQTIRRYQPYESDSAACDAEPPEGVPFTATTLDAAGRTLEVSEPDEELYGSASRTRVEYGPLVQRRYDAEDLDEDSDHYDTPTIERRDGLDRLVALERDLGGGDTAVTSVRYDALGRVESVIDPGGNMHRQSYDLLGRVTEVVDPNGGTTIYAYDDAGNEIERENAEGQRTLSTYDGVNRLLSSYNGDDREATENTWQYDLSDDCEDCINAAGHVVRATYPMGDFGAGEDLFSYDLRGRPAETTRVLEGVSFTSRFEYDAADRMVRSTLPDGTVLNYGWDAGDRVASIEDLVDGVRYNARGRVEGFGLHNGVAVEQAYDARMRLAKSAVIGEDGTVLQSLGFTRDRVGNTLAIEDGADEREGRLERGAHYKYDAFYRLIESDFERGEEPAEKIAQRYDMLDNLLSVESSDGAASKGHVGEYAYDGDQPNAVTKAGALEYAYDAAGRMVTRGERELSWDHRGRLVGAKNGEAREQLFYAADEQRVLKAEDGSVTHYVSGDFEIRDGVSTTYVSLGGNRVARIRKDTLATELLTDIAPEGDPDGEITAADAWLAHAAAEEIADVDVDGEPSDAMRLLSASARRMLLAAGPEVAYVHYDELGNVTLSTGPEGEVLGERSYYPSGETRAEHGYVGERGFGGKERDATTDLYAFDARQLDTVAGRFASPDPLFAILNAQNVVRVGEATAGYAYTANNFTSSIDPNGTLLEKLKGKGKGNAPKAAKPKKLEKKGGKAAAVKKFLKKNGLTVVSALTGLTAAVVSATNETDPDDPNYNQAADDAVKALSTISAGAWLAGEIYSTYNKVKDSKQLFNPRLTARDKAQIGTGLAAAGSAVVGAVADNFFEGDTADQIAGAARLTAGSLRIVSAGIGASRINKKSTLQEKAKVGIGFGSGLLTIGTASYALWGDSDSNDPPSEGDDSPAPGATPATP